MRALGRLLLVAVALLLVITVPAGRVAHAQATVHTLTEADNGAMLTVPVGDTIELRLDPSLNWQLSLSSIGVLTRPPLALVQGVQGLWIASTPGQTVISATGSAQCNPGSACPQFIQAWKATVTVTAAGAGGSSGATATYAAGWNLVGAPASTAYPVALYQWDPGQAQYMQLAAGMPAKAGAGYWAYFSGQTSVALSGSGSASLSLPLAAGQWNQIGDPSATSTATVSGADAVYTYDPTTGDYSLTTTLNPGQGAWAYSAAGATVQLAVSAPPTPAIMTTPAPVTGQVMDCGTVQERGPTGAGVGAGSVLNGATAQQAETCFLQAYQTCSAATLEVHIMGVDTSQMHTFSLSPSGSGCAVSDTEQSTIVPAGTTPARTYACASLSQQAGNLVFSACGALGDITVPGAG